MAINHDFLHELTNQLAIHPDYLSLAREMMLQHKAVIQVMPEKKHAEMVLFGNTAFPSQIENSQNKEKDSVAVIPVKNLLTKTGTWYDYGTDEISEMLYEAYANPSIQAVVLDMFSPGGTTHSVVPLKAAMLKRNKPVVAAINSMGFSACYYLAAFADKVIATDEMAQIGSIGVMAQFSDFDKYYENNGIKQHVIIPPESNWKNKAFLDAKEGNYETLITEELTPWAVHFQQVVKENRKGLDLTTPGLLNGRTFYASEGKRNGLIDDIMPMNDIVSYAFDLSKRDKSLNNLFN